MVLLATTHSLWTWSHRRRRGDPDDGAAKFRPLLGEAWGAVDGFPKRRTAASTCPPRRSAAASPGRHRAFPHWSWPALSCEHKFFYRGYDFAFGAPWVSSASIAM